jgi:multicomponent K+:H+ antiporter subunit D
VNHLILAPLLLPLAAGMINLQRVRKGLAAQRCVSIVSTAGVLLAAILLTARAATGQIETYALGGWPAPFGIVLVLDRLSALMLLVTALLALPVLVHACAGDDRCGRDFHVLFPIQLLGVNGAFLTGDLFNLFVFFEILLIASYCLALHGSGPARTRAALRYVVLNLVGSSLFLVALGAVYGACGTLNMADLARAVAGASPEQIALLRAASLLLLTVFGLKAAVLPLMTWLPGLYSAALPSVAALFAIMTKVGVYAVLRTQSLIFTPGGPLPEAAGLLLPLALATVVWGTLGILGGQSLREILAHLVIVSVGTLLAGIGLWNAAGIAAALYYMPHTTLVSGGLFLLSGHIARQRGPVGDTLAPGPPLSQAGRLGTAFLLGAMAVAGLPPSSGFIGKVLLLQGATTGQALWVWTVVLAGGLLGLWALARCGSVMFWRTEGVSISGAPVSWTGLAPALALLLAGLALAVLADPVARYAGEAAAQLINPEAYIQAVLGGGRP